MTEHEARRRMVAPGTRRPGKYREGVIQIHVTRACDKACFGCTQGSNLGGRTEFMSPEHFDSACRSLKGYFGVVGVFGGNPALHPEFENLCVILNSHFPKGQRGLWCNNPINESKAISMRGTFDPAVSNLNVHLDREAYDNFRRWWPESRPFGLHEDSRHSPPYVAMKDVVKCQYCDGHGFFQIPDMETLQVVQRECADCQGTGRDDSRIWELISSCDINQHWSAMVGVFRGQLRAWFCEVAGAQAMLHQDEEGYPDTGLDPTKGYHTGGLDGPQLRWWQLPMSHFTRQVRKHCFDCGVPLRGYGELAQAESGREQVSAAHADVYRPKRKGRIVETVTALEQLGVGRLKKMTDYLGNAKR